MVILDSKYMSVGFIFSDIIMMKIETISQKVHFCHEYWIAKNDILLHNLGKQWLPRKEVGTGWFSTKFMILVYHSISSAAFMIGYVKRFFFFLKIFDLILVLKTFR